MKKYLLLLIFALIINVLNAQLVDNKGNRNQTYPVVSETNPAIVEMVNQVDTVNLFNTISWMQQFIRDCASPAALTVQNYLLDRFDEIGLETYIHHHTGYIGYGDTLDAGNVIAIQRGTELPDEYIIIASHYDHPDGPGADDNASGTAGVLECARILSQYQFKRTILYIPFNGEERLMVGSYPFVQKCAREDMNILGVFNMDMIGFWPGAEYGPVTMYSGFSYISERLFDYYQNVANLYIPEMPTRRFTEMDAYGGDHLSFDVHEYPALYIGDVEYKEQNVYYHTPNDTIGSGVNCFALSEGFVKAVIAATAELADGRLAPQDFRATIKNGNVFLSWDEAPGTEFYKLFKDNELLAETTENSLVDENFVDGEWHNYFVKGVDPEGFESPASNIDSVFSREALQLPASYYFNDTIDDLHLYNENWVLGMYKQRKCLLARTYTNDNVLQMIETPWFSIPETTEDISVEFKMYRMFSSIWVPYNLNVFVEVTTDRKTWHKIAKIDGAMGQWNDYAFSINDYIGSDYVQVRIRFEGSGKGVTTTDAKVMAIDNLCINFSHDAVNEHFVNKKFNFLVSPNPTNGIVNITTESEGNYLIAVYNMLGVKMLSKESLSDGILDLSSFPQGIYFISVDNGVDRITKRIVISK
jgi:hypothetical protein